MSDGPETEVTLKSPIDWSKINPADLETDPKLRQLKQEAMQAQLDYAQSLENRYRNPNWFKVAAGFGKPQLGGFFASLGSANEALGEWQEQQRSIAPAVARMRAEIAGQQIGYGQAQKASEIIQKGAQRPSGPTPQESADVERLTGGAKGSSAAYFAAKQARLAAIAAAIRNNKDIAELKTLYDPSEVDEAIVKFNLEGGKGTSAPADASPVAAPVSKSTPSETGEKPKQEKLYVYGENGPTVNEEGRGFIKSGVPIISMFRTQAEQDALKHHKDDKGNWFTKEGLPVSELVGLHENGNALDVDPKKITPAHEKILKDAGFNRPIPDQDPGHWQRSQTVPASAEQVVSTSKGEKSYYPMTFPAPDYKNISETERSQRRDLYVKQVNDEENANVAKFNGYREIAFGPTHTNLKNLYEMTINMIKNDPDRAQRVFNIIRNNGQIAAALDRGIGASIGNFHANVNLPVEEFLRAGLSKDDQTYADRLMSAFVSLGNAKLRTQGITVSNATGNEYMNLLHSAANLGQTPEAALNNLYHDRANFDHTKEMYDVISKERRDRVNPNSNSKITDIMLNSDDLRALDKKYEKIHAAYDRPLMKRQ